VPDPAIEEDTKAFLDSTRGLIRANKAVKQDDLMAMLNPSIKGWAEFHSADALSQTFTHVDAVIMALVQAAASEEKGLLG